MILAVLALIIVAALLLVAGENRHQLMVVELPLGFRAGPFAVAAVIIASALAGAILVTIALAPAWIRASLRARRLRRELDAVESPRPSRGAPPPTADDAP
ncbi:MAG: lipopolysaccharide assembly protein LapA domain-containing protein [Nitrospirota bacterium]